MPADQPIHGYDRNDPYDGRWHLDVDSPIGVLRIVADAEAVVGLYHGDHSPRPAPDILGRTWHSRALRSPGPSTAPLPAGPVGTASPVPPVSSAARSPAADGHSGRSLEEGVDEPPEGLQGLLERTAVELGEYFTGTRRCFDVPVALRGTAFQRGVWAALMEIPFGESRSYRDIAEQLGNARMGRAVGAAVRANPVSIIVPGHRIVSSTGTVVGYAAGVGTKKALLAREAAPGSP